MKGTTPEANKGGIMNRIFALVVTGCLAVLSFAGDVVEPSLQVAGNDSAKVAKKTAKDTAKAVAHVGKFLL
jgi:hypothetical protein